MRHMLIEVGVDRHVDGFGFKHGLVERARELSIGDNGADGFECRGGRGSCLPWRGELWESQRVLFSHEIGCGTEVLVQKDSVIVC